MENTTLNESIISTMVSVYRTVSLAEYLTRDEGRLDVVGGHETINSMLSLACVALDERISQVENIAKAKMEASA